MHTLQNAKCSSKSAQAKLGHSQTKNNFCTHMTIELFQLMLIFYVAVRARSFLRHAVDNHSLLCEYYDLCGIKLWWNKAIETSHPFSIISILKLTSNLFNGNIDLKLLGSNLHYNRQLFQLKRLEANSVASSLLRSQKITYSEKNLTLESIL